jgi:hypothetical protein
LSARERMMSELQQGLGAGERRFLLSLVAAKPEWSLLGVPHLEQLPGLRWKLQTWNGCGRPTPESSPSNRTRSHSRSGDTATPVPAPELTASTSGGARRPVL